MDGSDPAELRCTWSQPVAPRAASQSRVLTAAVSTLRIVCVVTARMAAMFSQPHVPVTPWCPAEQASVQLCPGCPRIQNMAGAAQQTAKPVALVGTKLVHRGGVCVVCIRSRYLTCGPGSWAYVYVQGHRRSVHLPINHRLNQRCPSCAQHPSPQHKRQAHRAVTGQGVEGRAQERVVVAEATDARGVAGEEEQGLAGEDGEDGWVGEAQGAGMTSGEEVELGAVEALGKVALEKAGREAAGVKVRDAVEKAWLGREGSGEGLGEVQAESVAAEGSSCTCAQVEGAVTGRSALARRSL
jgi:hypothetical protein